MFASAVHLFRANPVVNEALLSGNKHRISEVIIAGIGKFMGGPGQQLINQVLEQELIFPGTMSGYGERVKTYC